MSLKIALDYDDTYTADPWLWDIFVGNAIRRGHDVRFCTFRMDWDTEGIKDDAARLKIPIIFTNKQQKRKCFDADIWIDDSPQYIVLKEDFRERL